MSLLRPLLLVLGVLAAGVARAQSITLSADSTDLVVGQTVGVSVVVRGVRTRGVPELAAADPLDVRFVDQSTSVTVVNGRADSFVKYRFAVVPRASGSWQLGPAYVAVPDPAGRTAKTLQSETLQLQVVPASAAGASSAPITVETAFDTDQAWQGQVVVYHQAFRSRVELAHAGWLGEPDDGLLALTKDRPELREYVVEDERGVMLVQESRRPYMVTATGPLRWEAPLLQADVVVGGGGGLLGMFQRTRREPVAGQPLALDVRPLPPAPPGASGLVGDFTLDVRLDRERAAVGQTVTWRVALAGDGNLDGYTLPLPAEVDGARVYEGRRAQSGAVVHGRYHANAVFEREVVPTREGKVVLPPVELVVFSPSQGDWVTLRAPERTLSVRPGEALDPELTSFAQKDLPEGGEEVVEGPRPLWRSGPAARLPWLELMPAALVASAAPGVLLLLLGAFRRAREAWEARARAAAREATPLERLEALPDEPTARLAALDAALRLGLALRAGVAPASLDRDAAAAGLAGPLAAEVRRVQETLDRARFAGAAIPPDLDERVRALLVALEAR